MSLAECKVFFSCTGSPVSWENGKWMLLFYKFCLHVFLLELVVRVGNVFFSVCVAKVVMCWCNIN